MSRIVLLALLLVAALVAGALLWLGGDTRTTDASDPGGRGAQVPAVRGGSGTELSAGRTSEDETKETSVLPGGEPARVAAPLARPDDLVIVVRDPGGRALAGLPLQLTGDGRELEGKTDADGRAVFRGARRGGGARTSRILRLGVIGPREIVEQLDPSALALDEVRIVAPAVGTLETEVVNDLGATPRGAVQIQLALVDPREEQDPSLAFERRSWRESGPSASFRFVEVGHRFEVSSWRKGFEVPSAVTTDGPARPGQTVRVRVQTGLDHPVLDLRAVDEDGGVLADTPLEIEPYSPIGRYGRHETRTDDAGGFTVDVETGWMGTGSLVVRATTDEGPLLGSVDLDGRLENGRNPQIDVVLSPRPALVSGVVLGPDGRPHAGARVSAGRSATWQGERSSPNSLRSIHATSGPDGSFALYGSLAEDVFRVWAEAGHLRSLPRQARSGEDLKVKLLPYWKVRGSMVLDGPRPRIELVGEKEMTSVLLRESESAFELPPTREGTYDLVFRFGENVVHRISSIELDRDVDVGEVDLSDAVTNHTIQLVGPTVTKGKVQWRACGSKLAWTTLEFDLARSSGALASFEDNEIRISTSSDCIDVAVEVPGHRRVEREGVSRHVELALQEALRVRLVLDSVGELPEPPYLFRCDPRVDGKEVGSFEGSPYYTAANREVVFLASRPGTMQIRWHLSRRRDGSNSTSTIGGHFLRAHETTIEVLDVPGEQRILLPLDDDALTALTRRPPF